MSYKRNLSVVTQNEIFTANEQVSLPIEIVNNSFVDEKNDAEIWFE